jgi:hypothetical protein
MSTQETAPSIDIAQPTATLGVTLSGAEHRSGDLSLIAESLDGLVSAAVWSFLLEPTTEDLEYARHLITEAMQSPKGSIRFFPRFGDVGSIGSLVNGEYFDPFDPFDASIIVGMNSWLRRTLQEQDPALYHRLFGFAKISKAEHRSPLFLELAVALGIALVGPPLLVYGMVKAIQGLRRSAAETQIRETELEIVKEQLAQQRQRTRVVRHLADAIAETPLTQHVSPSVLQAMIGMSSPAVADLGTSSLIGEVKVGLSTG